MTDTDDDLRFPVLVEYTQRHVIWVTADDQDQAVSNAHHNIYDRTDDGETLVEFACSIAAPKHSWDWEDVYSDHYGESYDATQDAHVQAHDSEMRRQKWAAERQACAEAGHPDRREPLSDGRVWCPGCSQYLPAVATMGGAA